VRILFLVLILLQSGCTRLVIYPGEMTQTAVAALLLPTSTTEVTDPPALTNTIITEPSATQEPSLTISPTQEATATISATTTRTPRPTSTGATATEKPPILYYTQGGDILEAVALRFGVEITDIMSTVDLPANANLNPDILLIIPDVLEEVGPADHVLPDSEIVYSPSAVDFDVNSFVANTEGYLSTYREWRTDGWYNGAEVINRVAYENSINPRLLLALVEVQSQWVYGEPTNLAEEDYPMGWVNFNDRGLYKQLSWAVTQLSVGYYGWRAGTLTELTFPDGSTLRLAPQLNAGTVALQYLFSKLYNQREWGGILYSPEGLPAIYEEMFDNPWIRAQAVEPLFPPDLVQPELQLPFEIGKSWNYTGGPHAAWGPDGVLAALDFAPPSIESGCVTSNEWVVAPAPGLVVRSGNGIIVIDLDGDGYEQTGWALFFLHISHVDRVPVGTWVKQDDPLGHPSCEGGVSTGTHFHIVRKYNGEWIPAQGPLPFVMSGWEAHNGIAPYEGTLTKGDLTVIAHVYGDHETSIGR